MASSAPAPAPDAAAAPAAPSATAPGRPHFLAKEKYKLVFLGDESVGKTAILTRFMYEQFEASYQATIGIDFLSKTIYLEDRVVRLQLWDTAGQERFRSLIPSYIRDSSVAVIVYDVTQRQSFVNTRKWIEDVRAERGSDVFLALVGNKCDLEAKRVVTREEAEKLAAEFGVMLFETSARSGDNVKTLFRKIASALPSTQTDVQGAAAQSRDVHLRPVQVNRQANVHEPSMCPC